MKQSAKKFEIGQEYDLGKTSLSEQEIIDFAKQFDPLDFHVNPETAQKTVFKGIIASGAHLFNLFYRKKWIPLFGHTVICGVEILNWKFLKPTYPNQEIRANVKIEALEKNLEKKYVIVTWYYTFLDVQNNLVQSLHVKISHKID